MMFNISLSSGILVLVLFNIYVVFSYAIGRQHSLMIGFIELILFTLYAFLIVITVVMIQQNTYEQIDLQLKQTYEKLHEKEDKDFLTGTINNKTMLEKINYEYERVFRYRTTSALAFLDIDGFRKMNEMFGYSLGDEVLKKTTEAITEELRATDILGRYSGDKFLVLMPNTTPSESLVLFNRIKQSISVIEWFYPDLNITFSIGVNELATGDNKLDVRAIIDATEELMLGARQEGPDNIKIKE